MFLNRKQNQPRSLAAFKAAAHEGSIVESVEKITGGTLAACHTGGISKMASAQSLSLSSVAATKIATVSISAIRA